MRTILSILLLFIVARSTAQERYGIAHSNFAGTDALYLNPARAAGQWPYVDIRLLGLDVHAWNSLVAWGQRVQPLVGEVNSGMAGQVDGAVVLRDARLNHRAFVQADALGPAFSLSLGRGTIGAGLRARAAVSASGVSTELGNFIFHGLGYQPQHGIRYEEPGIKAVAAAWSELSLSYAHILRAEGFSLISAGATLKYNLAHMGAVVQAGPLAYTVVDTALLQVHSADATYGYAMPAMNAGGGLGADIGFTYERTRDEADGYVPHRSSGSCAPMRYRYRIGASLIDLGGMRFKQATAGGFSSGAISIDDYAHVPVDSAEDIDSLLATSTNWSRASSLSIGLPTAASVQFDLNLVGNAYMGFAAVQQISARHAERLRRPNTIAITPRYESRYFEAALPVVVHEYDLLRPSIGFMLRFDGIVLGSDHIMPFISSRDAYGADVYLRVRWMIARSPFCKGKRQASATHRSGSKDMIPCATPNE